MTHTNIDGVLFNRDAPPPPRTLHQRVAADILALADEPPRERPSDVMQPRTDAIQQAYRSALVLAVVMRRQVEAR